MTDDLLTSEQVKQRLCDACGDGVREARIQVWAEGESRRESHPVWIRVDRKRFRAAVEALIEIHYPHLGVISGADLGDDIELLYHFFIYYGYPYRQIQVTIATTAPKSDPTFPTITDLIPGALTSEREKQEMLGVVIEGIPDARRLFLPLDFPEGVYPWRKDEKGIPPEMVKQLWKVGRRPDLLDETPEAEPAEAGDAKAKAPKSAARAKKQEPDAGAAKEPPE